MVGNRTATIHRLDAGSCPAENLFPAFPMRGVSATAQRIDWQVLKEQQHIPPFLRNPFFL
jgi:hypothetical protein